MRKEALLVLLIELVLFSSFVYGFEISSPGSSQVGYSSSSSFIDFNINNILSWIYELIADFFGIPMEDMQIRGGYLFAFVLAPMLLAYMMFYGIMDRLRLFDNDKINMGIPLLLALMLAPLGAYRRFFFAVTSFMTIGTATLLYIFFFVALLGWGYKHMYASGRKNFSEGNRMITDAKNKSGHIKDVEKKMVNLNREKSTNARRLHEVNNKIAEAEDAGKETYKLIEEKEFLEHEAGRLNEEYTNFLEYRKNLTKDINRIIHNRD